MDPVIEHSVAKIAARQWLLGSSMLCEMNPTTVPSDALASWSSERGDTFYLCRSPSPRQDINGDVEELAKVDRVHQAGTGAAVWAFGDVHIKAKAWVPELQSESDTIEFVQKTTTIPVPEVIFSWVDAEWNRSFLILRSFKGRTLYQAWPTLSQEQKPRIAHQIASYCKQLASSTSRQMETLSGKGVLEPWLTKDPPPLEPSWKPFVQGPFTTSELLSYLQDDAIDIGSEFYLYHADLGPTNIILGDDDHVVAVIDWESAAYYPRFWIATKPQFSAGFNLEGKDRSAWAFLLSDTLEEKGFKAQPDLYERWIAALNMD